MPLRLVTIPMSHFCEKARWGLDRAGLEFEEDGHLGALHYIPVMRARAGTTVPVLITPEGPIGESTDILEYSDRAGDAASPLFPRDVEPGVRRWVDALDATLGPDSRLLIYHALLPRRDVAIEYGRVGIPAWQQRLLPLAYGGLGRMLRRRYAITERRARDASRAARRCFDAVGEALADGRPYLVGDHLTAADITFASLAGPLLIPPEYGWPMPPLLALPPDYAATVREHREHPAGRWAMNLYRTERHA